MSAQGGKDRRQREASLSDPRDRDRKRKREKEHTKEKEEKHAKRDDRDKQDKQDKDRHPKRDGHSDRGGGDHKKRGDYGNDGEGRSRETTPHSSRGAGGPPRQDVERSARSSRQSDNRTDNRDDGRRDRKRPEEAAVPPIEAIEVDAPAESKKEASKADWREEMGGEEDERDLSDDEAAIAKKLVESRKRREAMMAKWVSQDKPEPEETKETNDDKPETAKQAGDDCDASGSDADADATPAEKADGEGVSDEQKKEVTKYIQAQKAKEEKEQDEGGMFGETADEALNAASRGTSNAISQTGASGDDWDDQEGYYLAQIGEVMDDQFLVVENACGKGVFSTVIKAKDQKQNGHMVAIKVMRANDMMKKAAEKEIEILQTLNSADKQNKRHIIRLHGTFYYRKHLCLVFECMWDDLRKALKKYTKGKGMALQAIRAYTKQLIVGLRHMHRCKIIHADIKPDNILISEGHNVVKFCDLGTALETKDAAITPYLVSRFYRAPEIILGSEYTIAVDVFALGATLFELFTGKILFKSTSNNDALMKIMEVNGKLPTKVIKKGMLWKDHFDEDLDFKQTDVDKYTKESVTRKITDTRPKKDVFEMMLLRVGPEKAKSQEQADLQAVKRVKQFSDLVRKMIANDQTSRVTANDALSHPFLEDRLGGQKTEGGAAKK